jgi:hypothetical protein
MTQAMPSAHFERQVDLYKALASTLGAIKIRYFVSDLDRPFCDP